MKNSMEKIQNHLNAKIEFQSIRDTYSLTVPTNASVKPEARDWIGIYRVSSISFTFDLIIYSLLKTYSIYRLALRSTNAAKWLN